jgi:quercetin dioxygenase-like cupin family protein
MFDERAARLWCQALARTLRMQRIDRDGTPYLERYFVVGWSPHNRQPAGSSVFLHHFVASDSAVSVHSHPWNWSASLILAGGYREERCDGNGSVSTKEFRPGDVNIIKADDKHRIDLLSKDCWTLFLAGTFEKPWGFAPSC